MDYQEFLKNKRFKYCATGKAVDKANINPILFEFQKDIVKWAVKKRQMRDLPGHWAGENLLPA